MTGNDVTYPHVAGSELEVTSFDQKSPGGGVEGLSVKFGGRFRSYRTVTRRTWQSHVRK